MMTSLPFSQACENNKQPILEVLVEAFKDCSHALEIGSGTGQHAVFFAEHLPHLVWQPSDCTENLPGITRWIDTYPQNNLKPPISLDVTHTWPTLEFDAVFSANTAHIMAWPTTERMIDQVGAKLPSGGVFALYGPMNYNGQFTSQSNAEFDVWLKQHDPRRGIRDFEAVNGRAASSGMQLFKDHTMPANNRLLVWKKA